MILFQKQSETRSVTPSTLAQAPISTSGCCLFPGAYCNLQLFCSCSLGPSYPLEREGQCGAVASLLRLQKQLSETRGVFGECLLTTGVRALRLLCVNPDILMNYVIDMKLNHCPCLQVPPGQEISSPGLCFSCLLLASVSTGSLPTLLPCDSRHWR